MAPNQGSISDTIVGLVLSGTATSRREVVEHLGVPVASATAAIKRLLVEGVLVEAGEGPSTGGRRPKLLRVKAQSGVFACAELGANHARFGIVDVTGKLVAADEARLDISLGADTVFGELEAGWGRLAADSGRELKAVAVGFPGPVDVEGGFVISPARMPRWGEANPQAELRDRFGLPAIIENDARAGALGEARLRREQLDTFIYVKAGTGIGGAWIVGGKLFRGPHGLAGEITHNQLPDVVHEQGCGCGNRGCLELVASGAALCAELAARGIQATGTRALVELARDSHPEASRLVRSAGARLGEVLAPLVNFLNPTAVIIGGGLSVSDAFVASVRGVLYDRCLPMCTQGIVIESSLAGPDAALLGLGELARKHVLQEGQLH